MDRRNSQADCWGSAPRSNAAVGKKACRGQRLATILLKDVAMVDKLAIAMVHRWLLDRLGVRGDYSLVLDMGESSYCHV